MAIHNPPVPLYQFHILLRDTSPHIWRRLLVHSQCSLTEFHWMIQAVMDWAGTYDYQFTIRGRLYGKIRRRGVALAESCGQIRLIDFDFREKERFTYEYHWGGPWADTYMWRCDIRMERGLRCCEKGPKNPRCIAGVGVSPPEDCEGPKAFTEFRNLFSPDYFAHRLEEMKADGDVKRYEEELRDLKAWRRMHFDRRAVNQKLKEMMDNPAVEERDHEDQNSRGDRV